MSTILAVLTGDPLSCTRVLHYSDKKSHTCEHGQLKGGGGVVAVEDGIAEGKQRQHARA